MDRLFDALGDPTRVAIVVSLIHREPQTLFELCTRLMDAGHPGMSRQAVARHLAVLRRAGVVEVRTVGRTSVHRLDRTALRSARDWLSTLISTQPEESP